MPNASRSPHGERGLKYYETGVLAEKEGSLPPRGAWIEITTRDIIKAIKAVAPPHGERGLK